MEHELKIEKRYLDRIFDGTKTCEVRLNDRDYQVGDTIVFKWLYEYEVRLAEASFDGDYCVERKNAYKITHVLCYPEALKEGWVILSIKPIKHFKP